MMWKTAPSTRSGLLGRLLFVALLGLGLVACGGTTKSESQKMSDALQAGLMAQAAGKLDEAAKDYKECLKHDSLNTTCLYDLGTVYQAQNLPVAAENAYRLTLIVDPNYSPAVFNLAIIRTKAGSSAEAITLYRQYITLMPNDPNGHFNLGLLLNATGNPTEGGAEIAEALRLDPTLSSRLPTPAPTPSAGPSSSPGASPSAS
jgi:tetratricopeptide (TPR) repeat protein